MPLRSNGIAYSIQMSTHCLFIVFNEKRILLLPLFLICFAVCFGNEKSRKIWHSILLNWKSRLSCDRIKKQIFIPLLFCQSTRKRKKQWSFVRRRFQQKTHNNYCLHSHTETHIRDIDIFRIIFDQSCVKLRNARANLISLSFLQLCLRSAPSKPAVGCFSNWNFSVHSTCTPTCSNCFCCCHCCFWLFSF